MRHVRNTTNVPATPLQSTLGSVWRGLQDRTPGGTVAVNGSGAPTTGYMVGGIAPELTVDLDNGSPFTRYNDIVQWVRRAVADNPNGYIGWWRDDATGFYHLDVSQNISDRSRAMHVAELRNEIAIWDVANNDEIRARR